MTARNRIPISDHFSLHEFENIEGLCMVHPTLLAALEDFRAAVNRDYNQDAHITREQGVEIIDAYIGIHITDAVRTEADNERLAMRLGYTDEGGAVSRNSRHLAKFGGIAADFLLFEKRSTANGGSVRPYTKSGLGSMAREYFDFVKDDYADGHIHVDMRNSV